MAYYDFSPYLDDAMQMNLEYFAIDSQVYGCILFIRHIIPLLIMTIVKFIPFWLIKLKTYNM